MEDLIAKIQAMKLTQIDSKIAEYILDHLNTMGLFTSTSLADAIGVSDSSIIRFVRKLGFKGYAEFRNEMASRIASHYDNNQDKSLLPGEKYARTKERLKNENLIASVGNYILDNLEKSFAKMDEATLENVVSVIMQSDRKFIAGFRGTASCAQYMANRLILLVPNVIAILHADAQAVETLLDIKKGDCLILYSFPRYSELNYLLMDIARENGAKIILITDRLTSPLANRADIVLVAVVDGLGFTNSYVVPMSISEVILLAISSQNNEMCSERLHRMDKVMKEHQLY